LKLEITNLLMLAKTQKSCKVIAIVPREEERAPQREIGMSTLQVDDVRFGTVGFRDFVIMCARQSGLPITFEGKLYPPDSIAEAKRDYQELVRARQDLARVTAWTPEEAWTEARLANDQIATARAQIDASIEEQRSNWEDAARQTEAFSGALKEAGLYHLSGVMERVIWLGLQDVNSTQAWEPLITTGPRYREERMLSAEREIAHHHERLVRNLTKARQKVQDAEALIRILPPF
jgi:hypothetical protein